MTIDQKNFSSAINSSAVELQTSNTQKMVDYVFSLFNRFINSNQTLRLDETFTVFFKVLSMDHVNVANHKRKRTLVVGSRDDKKIFNPGTTEVENGYPKNLIAFVNKCLLTSVILGFFKNEYEKEDSIDKTFELLLHLCQNKPHLPKGFKIKNGSKKFRNSKNQMKNKAGDFLSNYLKGMVSECEISPCGPFDFYEVLPKLSQYLGSQIHVIQSLQGDTASVVSFPDEFNCGQPQIFLDATLPNHVCLITNVLAFCRHFNKNLCIFCKRTSSLYHTHDCRKRKICKKCHRYFKLETTINHNVHFLKFCDSQIKNDFDENPVCEVCNQHFNTKSCMEAHESKCGKKKPNQPLPKGRNGYYCEKCEKCFNYGFANAEDAKKYHICDKELVQCKNCFQYVDGSYHLCKISQQAHTKKWPNLAIFSFTYKHKEECGPCFDLRDKFRQEKNLTWMDAYKNEEFSKLYCPDHSEFTQSYSEPNAAVIYKEIKRGVFQKIVLFEDELNFEPCLPSDLETFHYSPNYTRQALELKESYEKNVNGLKNALQSIVIKKKKTLLEKFVLLITRPEWQNYTFLSYNGDRCENLSLLRIFADLNLLPSLVQKGNKITSMHFTFLNLRFLNASAFITGSLQDFIEQFGLQTEQHFFPLDLNDAKHYDYSDTVPDLKYFLNFSDTQAEHDLIKNFYHSLEEQGMEWNFKEELLKSSLAKAEIIFYSLMTFLKNTFEFQAKLKAHLKIASSTYLHPFGKNITSLSGYTYQLFSLYFQNNYEIYSVKNEYSSGAKITSKKELLFVTYKEYTKNPECNFLHAFNNPEGQVRFKNHYADLYCSTHKKVFSFRGCAFHYCVKCMAAKNRTDESISFLKVPFFELKQKDEAEEIFYLTQCDDKVLSFEAVYECEFDSEMKKITDGKNCRLIDCFKLWSGVMCDRPTIRLTPRATVRSGLTEQFHLKWKADQFPNENFFISDVNSLYTAAAINHPFPVGKYFVAVGDELKKNIKVLDNKIFFNGNEIICGAAHVRIFAPETLNYPFLQYRVRDEHCYLALCTKCAENKSKSCKHTARERALESCWLVSDLRKSLELGYTIDEWFELHYYVKTSFILKDYSKILYALKVQNSGFPLNLTSDEEKQNYCETINKAMDFPEDFKLDLTNVCDNPPQKQLFKSMLNNFYGKFSQNSNFTETKFVNSHNQLMKIFKDNEVVGIYNINEFQVQVEYKPNKVKANTQSSIYIGAQITSYSRCIMYEHMMSIERAGGKIYSIINDAIFYSLPKNVVDPLPFSNVCGHFKSVIDPSKKILAYFALGNCNYSYLTQNPDGSLEQSLKVKGLSLTNLINQNKITTKTFENFIDEHFEKNKKTIEIPQKKIQIDKKTKQFQLKYKNFTFCNEPNLKRYVIDYSSRVDTLPFGYVNQEENNGEPSCKKIKFDVNDFELSLL